MKWKIMWFLFVLATVGLQACKGDDYVYPDAITEFIGLQTDDSGTGTTLVSDKGKTYRIQPREGLDGLVPDTLYRTISVYAFLDDEAVPSVKLYACNRVLSLQPMPAKAFKQGVKTEPVDIQSMWRSGNYLNMVLLVQVKQEKHTYHFVDEGITTESGVRTLHLRLYHDSNNDYAAFTHKAYLSIPLSGYEGKLQPGDKIRFALNTDKEGETHRDFDY